MIHPKRQPAGDVGVQRAIEPFEPLRNRIECREAAPDFAHVPPHALRVPVFDCREDPAPPVVEREYPHAVRPPHHVGRLGDDPPVVGLRGALTPAVRGEQSVRPHDAQHPRAGDSDPVQDPKPCVDLAMAFAVERGPSEIGTNHRQQLRVRLPRRRPPPRRPRAQPVVVCPRPPRVERRARALPDLTHPLDAETTPRRRGGRRAHRRDLRIAKGRRCSAARARSRSSSISIDSSPM